MTIQQLLTKFLAKCPEFTGSLELHLKDGKVQDIKSHQSHKEWLREQVKKRSFN